MLLGVLSGAARAQEVLTNTTFESGTVAPWFGSGSAQLQIDPRGRNGGNALLVTNRTATWNGANQDIQGSFQSGVEYEFSAWVRVFDFGPREVYLTMFISDGLGDRFLRLAGGEVPASSWQQIAGTRTIELVEPVSTVRFYVEGPPANVSFLVDDASVRPLGTPAWKIRANADIDTYRERDLIVRVVDQDGSEVTNAQVAIEQQNRDFRFGSAVSVFQLGNANYRQFFLDHFNMATPENAWKWPQIEFAQGSANYTNADQFFNFCIDNDIRIHGHNVVWSVEERVPQWVRNLQTPQEVQAAVDNRVAAMVGRYGGLVDAWDVNNEMLHGSFFQDRLGQQFRAQLFADVAAVDPFPGLFVNDFNIITEFSRLNDYIQQIQGLLNQGAPVTGIGVQGHYGQPVQPDDLRSKLDTLAQFGLPIRVTEYDYARDGASDLERADSLEAMYRVAFSHPAVEAISLWGFWAGAHWRGEDAALVELDWTVNPVGERLGQLLDEWWTNESGFVDPSGEYRLRAFHGTHRVTVSAPGTGGPVTVDVPLEPGSGAQTVVVQVTRTPCNLADVAAPFGSLDMADLLTIVLGVDAGDPAFDANGDLSVDFFDTLAYLAAFDAGCDAAQLPVPFRWEASGELILPPSDPQRPVVAIKDPSVVFHDGRWHIIATVARATGWQLVYLSFESWAEANDATPYFLDTVNPGLAGYRAAPQVFWFEPHQKWYLIYQSQQPTYSTTDDISDPSSWTAPRDFFNGKPASAPDLWIDYFVICDDTHAYLFFTGDDGRLYRSRTDIDSFPMGMSDPVIVLEDPNPFNLWEGSAHYKVKGTNQYLTLVEAIGPTGARFYRSWTSDRLDGDWTPLADTWENPFAGVNNVTFAPGVQPWTEDISHGELIRSNPDQTMTIDPANLRLLFQGREPTNQQIDYLLLPYRLGILTALPPDDGTP
jgi:endo-1,4-beta-xylanase